LHHSQETSGQIQRTIFLLPFKGINFTEVKKMSEKAFVRVAVIQDSEGIVSDWSGQQKMRNAAGPNSLFRQAAWFFYLHKEYGSWLWLEPDCWPVTDRWFYDIEREYFEVGKPFLGVQMTIGGAKNYMNGVGVYPWNAIQYSPLLVQATMWKQNPEVEVGFDVAGGDAVLKNAHLTKLIQLTNHLAQGNIEVRPSTVLCHGRPNLSGVSGESSSPGSGNSGPKLDLDTTARLASPSTEVKASDALLPPAQNVLSGGLTAVQPLTPTEDTRSIADPAQNTYLESAPFQSALDAAVADMKEYDKPESNYGGLTKEIRKCVQDLVYWWDNQPHRKVLIVKELRRAKLVPKHFR
jgi:hypothetical protein